MLSLRRRSRSRIREIEKELRQDRMGHDAAYDEALRRIRQAKSTGQHWLCLGDLGLRTIPDELYELDALTDLGLGTNKFDVSRREWVESDRWWPRGSFFPS